MVHMSQSMPTQEALIEQLLAQFESFSPQLQQCARYIVDNQHEVGVQSMRTLAANAGVGPNSCVRLAKQMGFDGYESFRERFRDFVRNGAGSSPGRARWLQTLAAKGGSAAVLGEMAKASFTNLEQMYRQQPTEDLNTAIDWMLDAKRVFVLGIGLAYPLAYNLWYLARMGFDHFILTPRHGSLPSDDLIRVSEDDCIIAMTFQPYRMETIDAIRQAKNQGARTIALTDSKSASVYRMASLGLAAPTHTPQFFQSNAALTALIETLVALLIAKAGPSAAEAIEAFNRARWEADIYVDY